MKISALIQSLKETDAISIKLPDGTYLPSHFHVTEAGLVTKHFIDCGGTERKEAVINFQVWVAGDYDHRLTPQKFLHILELSQKITGTEDLDVEVEYQQETIGKFGLEYDGKEFMLTAKHTACLAADSCGIPEKKKLPMRELTTASACCEPGSGCC